MATLISRTPSLTHIVNTQNAADDSASDALVVFCGTQFSPLEKNEALFEVSAVLRVLLPMRLQ